MSEINYNNTDNYDYLEEEERRKLDELVSLHIENNWNRDWEDKKFLEAIWYSSVQILPSLEVQVVIDANDKLYISTGSSALVWFSTIPKGMRIPIKCWIHTHPFGVAYFSGVDWRTVNTWKPVMQNAIVLGDNELGKWSQKEPDVLHHFTLGLNPKFTKQYQVARNKTMFSLEEE